MTFPELAKIAVETYIKEGKIISSPENLPKESLSKKAGVFVTIENQGHLRGCIGTYSATQKNIAEEVIYNALAAATQDYRFEPIDEKELSSLSYSVYILSEPELIKDIKSLNPRQFGIIVKTRSLPVKCGLLLPDLDGIDTVEQQIQICCQKAGIDPDREKTIIFKFTTEKYQ